MEAWTVSLTEIMAQQPAATVACAIALIAALEYVFPPAPGDALALLAIVLTLRADHDLVVVFLALILGAVVGSLVPYAIGRTLSKPQPGAARALPGWLGGERGGRLLARALSQFERRGAALLMANRFLPSLRAVFFVAAGTRRMPLGQVVVLGGLSATLWNAGLVAVAYLLDAQWDRLQATLGYYSVIAWITVVTLGAVWFWRLWRSDVSQ